MHMRTIQKNNLILKILAVIVIQALFLTQVDFSLAAVSRHKELSQEIALKFQNTADKRTSLISGVACVQIVISGILIPQLSLNNWFTLVSICVSDTFCKGSLTKLSNDIYKLFAIIEISEWDSGIATGSLYGQDKKPVFLLASRNVDARGPPVVANNLMGQDLNRTIEI